MKYLHRMALAVGLSALAAAAPAAPVTFSFETTITELTPFDGTDPWPAPVALGAALSVAFTYDSGAALLGTVDGPSGKRYRFAPDSIRLRLAIGSLVVDTDFASEGTGTFLVRDNFADPGLGDLVDGISLGLTGINDPNVVTDYSLILRGPTLDLIQVPDIPPTTQDARWASQRTALFQICRTSSNQRPGTCDLGLLQAPVNAVSEPPSVLLAGLALAGLAAAAQRRRAHASTRTRPGGASA